MKKRILALALAGTTAFSVFGAAVSAAYPDGNYNDLSGENKYSIDKYVTYTALDDVTITEGTTGGAETVRQYTYEGVDYYHTGTGVSALVDETEYATVDGTNYYPVTALTTLGYTSADWTTTAKHLVPAGTKVVTGDNGSVTAERAVLWTAVKATWTTAGTGAIVGDKFVAGDTPVYTYAPGTKPTYWNLTLTDIMSVPVDGSGKTAYLYDYWDVNSELPTAVYGYNSGYNALKAAYTAGGVDGLSDVIAVANLSADRSYSVYAENRYEVINAWYAFMYELGLAGDDFSAVIDDVYDFISNYEDMFYFDPVYNTWNGQINLAASAKVDVYNILGLLNDIFNASENGVAAYTTSELVYMMQQYDKYIGEYIDMEVAEGDEWGELLLELLNAANEEDFSHKMYYKAYVNEVEKLAYKYESATTAAQIKAAEEAMYGALKATVRGKGADTTALKSTIGGLFWNVKAAPTAYYTDATVENAGVVAFDLTGTTYVLNPMADYYEYGNDNVVYPGNDNYFGFNTNDATDEYEWFWNVYQLATSMQAGNKYQGSIDAVNAALEEAIAALEVTKTPKASAVMAMEETAEDYEGAIDTDYKAAWYGYYTSAYAFAEVAEGKAQTANAEAMIAEAGETLGWQSAQITVTKNEIDALKKAVADAEDAIDAIKNSDEYNAAQVTALNKAIAVAEGWIDMYDGDHGNPLITLDKNTGTKTGYLVGDKDQMVKSDIAAAIAGIEEAIAYSEVIEGWSKNADGAWQYGEDGEYVAEGWKKIGSSWYYFEEGTAVESDWRKLDGKWYYLNKNCAAAYGWCKVDGEWYYFDGSNAMKTGWVKVDGSWYYLAASGKMVTGEQTIDGVKYNFSTESNSLGQML